VPSRSHRAITKIRRLTVNVFRAADVRSGWAEDACAAQVSLMTSLFLMQMMQKIAFLILLQVTIRSMQECLQITTVTSGVRELQHSVTTVQPNSRKNVPFHSKSVKNTPNFTENSQTGFKIFAEISGVVTSYKMPHNKSHCNNSAYIGRGSLG